MDKPTKFVCVVFCFYYTFFFFKYWFWFGENQNIYRVCTHLNSFCFFFTLEFLSSTIQRSENKKKNKKQIDVNFFFLVNRLHDECFVFNNALFIRFLYFVECSPILVCTIPLKIMKIILIGVLHYTTFFSRLW